MSPETEKHNLNYNKDKPEYKHAHFKNDNRMITIDRWVYHSNEDYFEELIGKTVKIAILNQPLLIGIVREFRKYFIKVENPEGKTVLINKAFIITIEPVGVKP
jgi:sRNA-binding regulator protein Hfq